jgi:hypothetical protein
LSKWQHLSSNFSRQHYAFQNRDQVFFGGHKRLKSKTRVIQTFKMALPVKAFFDTPTVAEMATIITENQSKSSKQS